MTDEEIKNAWSYIEGKADGLVEAGRTVNLPVMFARYIIECTSKQRPWVGLTDEEWSSITDDVIGFNSCCGWEEKYAKAIEATLKEKNHDTPT